MEPILLNTGGVCDACARSGILSGERPDSLAVLRPILEQPGCERVEAESAVELSRILPIRSPTLAIIACEAEEEPGVTRRAQVLNGP